MEIGGRGALTRGSTAASAGMLGYECWEVVSLPEHLEGSHSCYMTCVTHLRGQL